MSTTYDENDNDNDGIVECPASFMDTSMYYFPSNPTMMRASCLDFGVIIQPLSKSSSDNIDDDDCIPLINFGSSGVIRCRSCRAYINPYITWINNGHIYNWVCNLCGISNEITKMYYDNYLNYKLLELQYSSIEIVAPDEYCVRPPQSPSYLFIINVNKQTLESNIIRNISDTIKSIINNWNDDNDNDNRIKIGFITYSDQINFYSFSSSLIKPKIITINDVDNPFLPIPANQIMCNLSESYDLISNFLTNLHSIHALSTCSSENALGSALKCGSLVLKEIGGKMICFSYGLSSLGLGAVINRSLNLNNNNNNVNINEYDKLLKRSNNYFMDLAIILTKYQISCDLFQISDINDDYCDISTIKGICRCSGGELYYYNNDTTANINLNISLNLTKLLNHLNQGWESVMRIRVSRGISIKHYYGCFYRRNADLLSLPTIDEDKTITILIQHSNKNKNKIDKDDKNKNKNKNPNIINAPYVYIQSALLYTDNLGRRRIRCCTKRIPITSSYDELFSNINLSVMTSLIAKQAVFKMLSKDIATSRMFIQDSCISALKSYISYCKTGYYDIKSENDLPLSLRYWALNTLGLLKCSAFSDIRDTLSFINIDNRCVLLTNILHMNYINIELLIRPQLYCINDIYNLNDNQLNDEYYIPNELPLTIKSIQLNNIYLLDNGQNIIFYINKNVNIDILNTFFNNKLNKLKDRNDNKYIMKLQDIIQYLQSINYRNQSIKIIKYDDINRNKEFATIYLIRDRTDSVMSYHEFFQFIHKTTKLKH